MLEDLSHHLKQEWVEHRHRWEGLSGPPTPSESLQCFLLALLPLGSYYLNIFLIKLAFIHLFLLFRWNRLVAQDLLEVDAAMLLLKLRLGPI